MKRTLLLVVCTGMTCLLTAQNAKKQIVNNRHAVPHQNENDQAVPSSSAPATERKHPLVITNTAVNDIPVGNAANAFGGYTRPARSIVYADPILNTVIVTHRAGPACTPPDGAVNSGVLMFDISKDGGTTWNPLPSLGPTWNSGTGVELARYPSGVIYNPSGNINPDSAYTSVFGACTGPVLPGGSIWIGHAYGAAKMGAVSQQNQGKDRFDSTVSWIGLIPESMTITQQGVTWVIDRMVDGTTAYAYLDTLIIRKGTWNATTKMHDYSTTLFPLPVTPGFLSGATMAFAPNGQTGWIVANCNNDLTFAPDSSQFIVAFKTTDGGNTWSAPIKIDISTPAAVAFGDTSTYSTAYWPDASVDSLGNLYVHTAIFPSAGGGGIFVTPGSWGQCAVYTSDGGATWKVKLLDRPQTAFYTTTGTQPIGDWPRGQVSTNWAGSKMVFTWFDTDTSQFPGGTNSNPNALARYYDIATDSWDAAINLTAGSAADGSVTFGMVSEYLLPCGGNSWEVPIAYQMLQGGNESGCVQYHYVDGACITGVGETLNPVFNLGSIYPNPAGTSAVLTLNLLKAAEVEISIHSILGQTLSSEKITMSAGNQEHHLGLSQLTSGIYIIEVKAGQYKSSIKLIKN